MGHEKEREANQTHRWTTWAKDTDRHIQRQKETKGVDRNRQNAPAGKEKEQRQRKKRWQNEEWKRKEQARESGNVQASRAGNEVVFTLAHLGFKRLQLLCHRKTDALPKGKENDALDDQKFQDGLVRPL